MLSKTTDEKRKLKADREIELKKIDVLDSNYQTWFNVSSSILIGGVISFLILILTAFYGKQLHPNEVLNNVIAVVLIMAAYIALIVGIRMLRKNRNEHLVNIDRLLDRVKNGETLPSIFELSKSYEGKTKGEQK